MNTLVDVPPVTATAPQQPPQVALDRGEVAQAAATVSTALAREDADLSTGDKVLAALDGAVVAEAQGQEQATLARFDSDQGALAFAQPAPATTHSLSVEA